MDFVSNRLLVDDSSILSMKSSNPTDPVQSSPIPQDQLKTSVSISEATGHAPDSELNNLSDENAAQIPSGLIAHCVATLLMIQVISSAVCSTLSLILCKTSLDFDSPVYESSRFHMLSSTSNYTYSGSNIIHGIQFF